MHTEEGEGKVFVMARAARNSTPSAIVYLRTASEADGGVGLDVQEAKCRAHAEQLGWPVVAVFRDDGVSGLAGVEDRPGLQSSIDAVKATPGVVVVVSDVSRLARSQSLLSTLLDDREGYGLPVSSATDNLDTRTPAGRAMLGMMLVLTSASNLVKVEEFSRRVDQERARAGRIGKGSRAARSRAS